MEKIERCFRRLACQHAVFGAIVRTQIAFNGPQNIRVVIHAEEYWFCHGPLSAFGTEGSRKNRVKAVRCGSLDLVAGVQEEVRSQKFARLLNRESYVMEGMSVQATGGATRTQLRSVAKTALRAWPKRR